MKRKIAVLVMAIASVALLWGSPAYASDYGPIFTSDTDPGGQAEWHEATDQLTVCDRQADGYGVRAWIYRPTPPGDSGNGTVLMAQEDSNSSDGCKSTSRDISESGLTSIKICLYHTENGSRVYHFCRWHSLPGRY
jgi:hypothetical protein